DGEGKFTKFYSEDGSYEVIKDNTTGKEKHILYIGGTPYDSNIVYLKDYTESSGSYKFLHKDYIGSILAISDEVGNKLEQRHFDAWGNFTHLKIGTGAIITDQNIIRNSSLVIERGYTSHEHFTEVGIIHMNGRLYDPLLRRFLNADENIQDPTNTQNYNKYGYVLNNPLMFNDPSGEIFWFAALTPIIGKLLAGVVAGAIAGSIVGVASYMLGAAISGNWSWSSFGSSILMGAVAGAISGGMNPGVFSASTGTLMRMGGQVISSILPAWDISIGNFSFSVSPSIAIGKGWGIGANFSATFRAGDFAFSGGFGIMNYGAHAGSGNSGWEFRKSIMAGTLGKEGNLGLMLGTNMWSGMHSQQTGIIRLASGDFSMTYENDGSPFAKGPKWSHLGDNNDRWRTAAMTINVGDFTAGFNLFTGERKASSYAEYDGADAETMQKYNRNNPYYLNGIRYNYGLVEETGPRYRLGAAYIGWGNYRVGIDSDRYVRRPIQNILAHDWISAQPGFEVLSKGINPYFQYQTRNKFTSW
ncbi:polymorphic toxin type 23 domain-containing protein, partial [Chryseobacterium sp. CKR4-1]|uniref:polymorphic toxin type 23 domain-containing protein n=1 Tax=Chryseobacterium sp. CKR4-1 TaxID=3068896 RepID=UPI0027969B32